MSNRGVCNLHGNLQRKAFTDYSFLWINCWNVDKKKYNTITFSLCIVIFVCWKKISEFVFCKKGGGVVGEGLPTGKNHVFEHARDRRLY